jgi:hypothetical protein
MRVFPARLKAFGGAEYGILQLFVGKWFDDNVLATNIKHTRPHPEARVARVNENGRLLRLHLRLRQTLL